MGEKVGRPKEPSKDELKSGNVVQRVRELERRAGRGFLPYPQQLFFERKLTAAQLAASETIASLYGKWARFNALRPDPKSQSFEFSTGGAGDRALTPEENAKLQESIDEVNAQWKRIETCIPDTPRKEAWAWVTELCVQERYVPAYVLRDIKVVLNRVVAEFELGAVEEADPHMRTLRFPVRTTPSIVPTIKPTRSRPRLTRQQRLDKGDFAARTDDAKPKKPSDLTGDAAVAAKRDREGLERTLLRRQAAREAAEQPA